MTKEEKQLLLQDLCARLEYGVRFHYDKHPESNTDVDYEGIAVGYYCNLIVSQNDNDFCVDRCKLFLRPMSSMTEEEKREIYDWLVENDVDWFDFNKLRLDEILISFDSSWLLVDWLNAHHFDYRGLIEKGLALEAPKDRKEDEK